MDKLDVYLTRLADGSLGFYIAEEHSDDGIEVPLADVSYVLLDMHEENHEEFTTRNNRVRDLWDELQELVDWEAFEKQS